jgi:hypothetical protein
MMRGRLLALTAAAALALTACGSQIAGLAPVSGDAITSVRIAAIDVLLEQGVQMKVVPVCTTETSTYECTGETVEGAPIAISANNVKPLVMQVSVDGSVIYDGPVQEVLDEAAVVNP